MPTIRTTVGEINIRMCLLYVNMRIFLCMFQLSLEAKRCHILKWIHCRNLKGSGIDLWHQCLQSFTPSCIHPLCLPVLCHADSGLLDLAMWLGLVIGVLANMTQARHKQRLKKLIELAHTLAPLSLPWERVQASLPEDERHIGQSPQPSPSPDREMASWPPDIWASSD